jgi:predicted TIM-barrel fold metal-dependent hydrolase
MIIDANTHVTVSGSWFATDLDASVSRLLKSLDASGADKAMLVPLPGILTNAECRDIVAASSGKLIGAYTFNPGQWSSPLEAQDEFIKEFENQPRALVKFHNRLGKYHPMDSRFIKVLEANEQLSNPMAIGICGIIHDRNVNPGLDTATYFYNLAQQFKSTTLVVMHGGGPEILRIADMCRELHHLYLDLSLTVSRFRKSSVEADIRWLCQQFDRRLIWGSDFPEYEIGKSLDDIREIASGIEEEKLKNILGVNLLNILKP